jgi:hypothetical protein
MHAVLAATVLVSGLAVGDGGSGRPATTARVDFAGDWVGTLIGPEPLADLRLTEGRMWIVWRKAPCLAGRQSCCECSLVAEDGRTVRVTIDGNTSRELYTVSGQQVRVCFHDGGAVVVLQRPRAKK